MLWMYDNKAQAGTWTSQNGSDPQFLVSNLQNFLAAKVWKSTATLPTERLTLDLGATTTPAVKWYLNLHANNFADVLQGDIVVEGNATNVWTSPTFSDVIPAAEWGTNQATGNKTAFLEIGSAFAGLRYWRITMVKNNGTDILQIGIGYLGPGLDTGDAGDPEFGSFGRTFAELVNKDSSILGQVYAEQRANFNRLRGRIPVTPEATEALLRVIWPFVGTWRPFFLQVRPDAWPTDTLSVPFYVRMTTPVDENLAGYGAGYLWTLALAFEEQL